MKHSSVVCILLCTLDNTLYCELGTTHKREDAPGFEALSRGDDLHLFEQETLLIRKGIRAQENKELSRPLLSTKMHLRWKHLGIVEHHHISRMEKCSKTGKGGVIDLSCSFCVCQEKL